MPFWLSVALVSLWVWVARCVCVCWGSVCMVGILLIQPKLQNMAHQAPKTTDHAARPPSGGESSMHCEVDCACAFCFSTSKRVGTGGLGGVGGRLVAVLVVVGSGCSVAELGRARDMVRLSAPLESEVD